MFEVNVPSGSSPMHGFRQIVWNLIAHQDRLTCLRVTFGVSCPRALSYMLRKVTNDKNLRKMQHSSHRCHLKQTKDIPLVLPSSSSSSSSASSTSSSSSSVTRRVHYLESKLHRLEEKSVLAEQALQTTLNTFGSVMR